MIKEKIKIIVKDAIKSLWPDNALSNFTIETSSHAAFGDYATNAAFLVAKLLSEDPTIVAKKIIEKIQAELSESIDHIEYAGNGYINFFLSTSFLQKELEHIRAEIENYGNNESGKDKIVIVEYPSTNVAKAMHYGHSRVCFIGDALARIYEAGGYNVIRWDYIGDWGTSFGKLIKAYKLWGDKKSVEAKPIEALLALYVRFNVEAKSNLALNDEAREEFRKLESGDLENKELWEWFRGSSLAESQKVYDRLGLHPFDVLIGESFYEKDMQFLVKELLEKGVAQKSEGAVIINLDKYSLPPALIQKSDGTSLYITRDIANLRYRLANYHPDKILHVVGNEQSLHFRQLLAIAEILALTNAHIEHVKFGLVLGEDRKKLKSREGKAILLEDVIDEAIDRALAVVNEKNKSLTNKEKKYIANAVAIGALKYNDLKEYRTSDIVFDWTRILDFTGNSGPYIQYTYARIMRILSKASLSGNHNFALLDVKEELDVIKKLIDFPEAISRSIQTFAPNHIALYLYELANILNSFYEKIPVLTDDNIERRNSRLLLLESASVVVKKGLVLLGIEAIDKI